MATLLENALARMKTDIEAMTTVGGYNHTWGTCNQPDEALVTVRQYALIEFMDEECLDDITTAHAQSYHNQANVRITVYPELTTETSIPNWSIESKILRCMDDLKEVFGNDYTLNGTIDYIQYRRTPNIYTHSSGDRFVPKKFETLWEVYYHQDRLTPTYHG